MDKVNKKTGTNKLNNYKDLKTKERESNLKTKDLNNYKSSLSDHSGTVHSTAKPKD